MRDGEHRPNHDDTRVNKGELHEITPNPTYPESTVSQLRLNLLTGRWVTVVPNRAKRATDFAPRSPQVETDTDSECPF